MYSGKLVDDEEMRVGNVAFSVYKRYWTSFGNVVAIIVVVTKILQQGEEILILIECCVYVYETVDIKELYIHLYH